MEQMGFAVWLRHEAPGDDEHGTRGRADQNHSAGEGGQHRSLCCCCPLHAQLAFVGVRNSVPSQSHSPSISPEPRLLPICICLVKPLQNDWEKKFSVG